MTQIFKRRPRFRLALIGAAAIAGFSVLGALSSVSPVSRPASAADAQQPQAFQPAGGTQALVGLTSPPKVKHARAAALPRPAHIVIVLEGSGSPRPSSYLGALMRHGADFTDASGVTASVDANYLALFSGSTHGMTADGCPQIYRSGNLGNQIIKSGRTFAGYAESLPSVRYTGCTSGKFDRAHAPWIDFAGIPASDSMRFSHFPQHGFATLPTISFVTPNLCDGMHDCAVATGDGWLKANMSVYASWAKTHHSLLIVAFGAASGKPTRIPLVMYGQSIRTGTYSQNVNHYSILRTIEAMYGLPCLAHACDARPMTAAFAPS